MDVVAINYAAGSYSLGDWKGFWRNLGAKDVVWAQITDANTMTAYDVVWFAGTTVIVDRQGKIAYRDDHMTTYEKYRAEIKKVL